MLSLEEVRKRKQANYRKVTVVLDAEWGAKFQALAKQVGELLEIGVGNVGGDKWEGLNAELEQMRKEAPEHTVDLLVKGISDDRYSRVLRAHPSTAEQRRAAKDAGDPVRPWNTETFPPALLALCLVDEAGQPWATEAELVELMEDDEWNSAEMLDLFDAALEACLTRPRPSFG